MEKARVLFVEQAIMPYLKETPPMSRIGRHLPPGNSGKRKRDQNIHATFW